jgi:glycosyltransferase involved in cell wall biosynthesis
VNVLFLATSYPGQTGGLGAYVERLAEGLGENGHEVHVAVRENPDPLTARSASGGELSAVSWAPTGVDLFRLICASDVTHMNGFWLFPATVALVTRTPLIWTHHEYDTTCPIGIGWYSGESTSFALHRCVKCMTERGLAAQMPRRLGLLPIRRAIAQLVQANVTPTMYMATRLQLPRSFVIGHGTEERERAQRAVETIPRFLFLGRLIREKGCDILVEAAHFCRNVGVNLAVEICGDGPERGTLERQIRARGLESVVSLTGSVGRADVASKIAQARAVVVPSVWDEVAGFVALESMAAGVPVIASRVGGLAEIVDGAGLLVERGSPEALGKAMLRLAQNGGDALAMGGEGHARHRRNFRLDRMVRDHERLYEQITTSRVSRGFAEVHQSAP